MPERIYYTAYDDRYRQVHQQNLRWFDKKPSAIVIEAIRAFSVQKNHKLLEIGCGEGRDAFSLLEQGYDLLATDVSEEAICFCRENMPSHALRFQTLDCVTEQLGQTFDFIYAVAVIHMLVPDVDRQAFYRFIHNHLSRDGIALICTMGDGEEERQTDTRRAFELQERIHEPTGERVRIANTSCRMVNFQTFSSELAQGGLQIVKKGITSIEPDFPQMMFAVVEKCSR